MVSLSTSRWRHAKTPLTSPLTSSHLHGWSSVSGPSALLFSLFFALLITLIIATPAQAQDSADGLLSANAQTVVADINRMRAANGVAPLAIHPQLVLAAQTHVGDMVANANYSHTGSDGSSIGIRVSRTGFQSTAGVSENWVAVNDPAQAVTWWMNSYVHRTNMLNPKWSHIGLSGKLDTRNGMHVFVAVFGTNGSGGGAVAVIAAASQPVTEYVPAGGMNYTIRPGDTLMGVAQRYGLKMSAITAINSISEESLLQIGQVLRLPGSGDPAPGIGGAAISNVPENLKTSDYVVRSGDTLVGIGVRLNQEWQTIAALNGLGERSVLHIGQVLKVPASDQSVFTASSSTRSHTVQPGETVITIALQYGLGWKTLLDFNGLSDNSLLTIGQTLRLP